MNQILLTPHPDNIMTKDTNNPTPKNNAWKYEVKISAMKSYVQCELSNLHNKIERFMETFNKTISNFETKPYEILQDNIEFLQNELRSKDFDGHSNRCSGKSKHEKRLWDIYTTHHNCLGHMLIT